MDGDFFGGLCRGKQRPPRHTTTPCRFDVNGDGVLSWTEVGHMQILVWRMREMARSC